MFNKTKIILTRKQSGEHAGWWCASFGGLGVFAPTVDGARAQLLSLLAN